MFEKNEKTEPEVMGLLRTLELPSVKIANEFDTLDEEKIKKALEELKKRLARKTKLN